MFSKESEDELDESHPEYEESTWGKNVDGQFVIDGFKFKGKQPFRKAKEDLKKLMERVVKGGIGGYTFIIKDSRLKGIELEVDLEVTKFTKNGTLSWVYTQCIAC